VYPVLEYMSRCLYQFWLANEKIIRIRAEPLDEEVINLYNVNNQ